jgi:hypothetical protein
LTGLGRAHFREIAALLDIDPQTLHRGQTLDVGHAFWVNGVPLPRRSDPTMGRISASVRDASPWMRR